MENRHIVDVQETEDTVVVTFEKHKEEAVEETFSQINRDKEMAKQFGLSMAFEPFGNKSPATPIVEGDDGEL